MKKLFLTISFFSFCAFCQAQPGKEAWHWHFGVNAALDFSSGIPVAGYSKLNVLEGSASISDPNTGQLLFYTDGDTVWDRNQIRMPNGIGLINGIQGTTTQAATIIRKPGSQNLFYVITADYAGYPNQGVFYSIVDMNLNSGLGDVTVKNVPLTPPSTTEKVTGVKHCNGIDYWILTHSWNSNTFNAYLLTNMGINPTPVVSSVGTVLQDVCCGGFSAIGYLRASPNGRKLASCTYAFSPSPFMELFDFDNATGMVTNPQYFVCPGAGTSPNWNGAYGCSFSPDGSKLYITRAGSYFHLVEQFDLSVSGTPRTIINGTVSSFALQLGPDGKIYVGCDGCDSLAVINYPDSAGPACGFQSRAVTLLSGSYCREGLPNFIDGGIFSKIDGVHDIIQCGTFVGDTANAGTGATYYWSTGDTTQKAWIGSPGIYWVQVTNANGCVITDTLRAYAVVSSGLDIVKDTMVCSATGNCFLNPNLSGVLNYSWDNGTTSPSCYYSTAGSHWVDYTVSGGCVIRDSFFLTIYTKPVAGLGPNRTVCLTSNQPYILNAPINNGSYLWSTGDTTQNVQVLSSNNYWVKITSGPGCFSTDTVHLWINKDDIINDTIVCVNQFPFVLNGYNGGGPNNFFAWSGGQIGPNKSVVGPGTYVLTIFVKDDFGNLICTIKDTAVVTSVPCTGISELTEIKFAASPNPSNGNLFVRYKIAQDANLEVTDIAGKLLASYVLNAANEELNIENLKINNGMYYLRLKTHFGIHTQKLIIQH